MLLFEQKPYKSALLSNVFWVSGSNQQHIERAELSGGQRTPLVTTMLSRPQVGATRAILRQLKLE